MPNINSQYPSNAEPAPPEVVLSQEQFKMPVADFVSAAAQFPALFAPTAQLPFPAGIPIQEKVNYSSLQALRNVLGVRAADKAPYSYFSILKIFYGLRAHKVVLIYKLELASFSHKNPATGADEYQTESTDILDLDQNAQLYVNDGHGNLVRANVKDAQGYAEAYRSNIQIAHTGNPGEKQPFVNSNNAGGDVKNISILFQTIDAWIGRRDFHAYCIALRTESQPASPIKHSVAMSLYLVDEIPPDYPFATDFSIQCPPTCRILSVLNGAIIP